MEKFFYRDLATLKKDASKQASLYDVGIPIKDSKFLPSNFSFFFLFGS